VADPAEADFGTPSLNIGQCLTRLRGIATVIWNDCRVGRLAKTAFGGVERKEHLAGNKPPPTGVCYAAQLPFARWGRHSKTRKFKGIAGTTPRRQFDNSGHVAL